MNRLLHNIYEEFIFFFRDKRELTKYVRDYTNNLYEEIALSKIKMDKDLLIAFLKDLSDCENDINLKNSIDDRIYYLEKDSKSNLSGKITYHRLMKYGIIELFDKSHEKKISSKIKDFRDYIKNTQEHIIKNYKQWRFIDNEENFNTKIEEKAKKIKEKIKRKYLIDLPIFTLTSILIGIAMFYFSGGILGSNAILTLSIIALKSALPVFVSVNTTYLITSRLLDKKDEIREIKTEFNIQDNILNCPKKGNKSEINNYLELVNENVLGISR